jgi:hypothetical protein
MKNFTFLSPTATAVCLAFYTSSQALVPIHSLAQQLSLPEGKSEYRFNQTSGNTSSVSVGINSGFGVNSTAQASPSYNASSSAALILNSDQAQSSAAGASLQNYNSSSQFLGGNANNPIVNVKITANSIQTKATDGTTSDKTIGSEQLTVGENFSDSGESSSTADFAAEGFGAVQDVRFRGKVEGSNDSGTTLNAGVSPLLMTDEQGNMSAGTTYGTGSSSANADTRTRFQADITSSIFVNAFISSF